MRSVIASMILLTACGGSSDEPRFGSVNVSPLANTARLSGQTGGGTPALEMQAGCAGFVDPTAPMHRITVAPGMDGTVVGARSNAGPVGLVIVHGEDVFCESDSGSGHRPRLLLREPGSYDIYVAALNQPATLAYDLEVGPLAAAVAEEATTPAGATRVSVTITTTPVGAHVRRTNGQELGTTPLMLTEELPASAAGSPLTYMVSLDGHADATVSGIPSGGTLVLNQALQAAAQDAQVSATGRESIRDYHTARMEAQLASSCVIGDMSADIQFRHSFVSDLIVRVQSPAGTTAIIQRHRSGRARTVDFGDTRLAAFRGEQASGRWVVSIEDDVSADTGTFEGFTLNFNCGSGPAVARAPVDPDPSAPANPRRRRPVNPYGGAYTGGTVPNGSWGSGQIIPANPGGTPGGSNAIDPWNSMGIPQVQTQQVSQGTISINSTPPAAVTLDGVSLGQTPVSLSTNVGAHTVALTANGQTQTRNVNVSAGATAVVRINFNGGAGDPAAAP